MRAGSIACTALMGLAALLTACAVGPRLEEIQSLIPSLEPAQGRIFFYRELSKGLTPWDGAAYRPNIFVNGEIAGRSKLGGFFFLDVQPGPIEVWCSTGVENKVSFLLEAGHTRYVRLDFCPYTFLPSFCPELVDSAEGAKKVAEGIYIGRPLQ
jgi:hypothetical protein